MAPFEDRSNIPMQSLHEQSTTNFTSASNSAANVASKDWEATTTSASISVVKEIKKNGSRAQPRRQCKEKQTINAPKSNNKPKTDCETEPKASGKHDKKTKSKDKRLSRSARKALLKSLKKAVKDAADAVRRPCLRVSRTVELVNQSDESWREEQSKLLFMLSLGLTPIFCKESHASSSTPHLKISLIPKEKLPKARSTWERELDEIASQLTLQTLRKLWRERRAEILLEPLQNFSPSFKRPVQIEVIDLSEDDESCSSSSSNFDDDVIILD